MLDTILQTKLYMPPPHANWVKQPRLLAQLKTPQTCKLILISAPAGYGKTTLIAEWVAQNAQSADSKDSHTCWLSLDEDDGDPQMFFRYLSAAMQTLPDTQSALPQLLQANQTTPAKVLIKAFVHDVTTVSVPFTLILDDYHVIESAEIERAMALLLDHMPPHMTLVIISRSDPGFPISRLRARGELIELRADDLRFTTAEARQFLQQSMGLSLTDNQIAALEARTEGWIAGLQMAALSMQNRPDLDGFLAGFTGSHRFIMDYLVEEVFNQQPPEVQQFLMQTAVLNRFNAALCNAVRQTDDSEQQLRYIEENNLFLIPLDDRRYWYRYHHLFADFFRMQWGRQNNALYSQLHGRASDWFANYDLLKEAFYHAEQANDVQRIAKLLTTHAATLMQEGRFTQLQKWLDFLPTEIVETNSILFMTQLWVETTLLGAGTREPKYDAAQAFIESDPALELEELRRRYLLAQIDATRTMFAVNRSRADDAIRFGNRALAALPANELRVRQTVNLQLGHILRFKGDFSGALVAYRQVLDHGAAIEHQLTYFLALCHTLRLLRLSNRLDKAADLFDKHIAPQHASIDQIPLFGWAFMESATLQLARGRLDDALALAQQALPLCEQTGFTEAIAYVYHIYACVYLLQQQPQLAQEAQDEVETLMQPHVRVGSTFIKRTMALRFARLQGDAAALETLLEEKIESNKLSADLQFELKVEIAWAYLTQRQPAEVLAITEDLRQTFTNELSFLSVPLQLLTSTAYHLLGQRGQALDTLKKALSLAVPQNDLAPFFMGGEPVQQLLHTAYSQLDKPSQQFVDAVFAVLGTAAPASPNTNIIADQSGLVDPLSQRELEILQLIVAGLKNKDIAEQLFISLNTVLYHNKNIYGKLGITKRTLAVTKARELGLIQAEH